MPVILHISLKARGEFFKILFGILIAVGALYGSFKVPPTVTYKVARKTYSVKTTYVPYVAYGLAALAILKCLYLIALAKTTRLEVGGRSIKYSRGIFIRDEEPIDFTGIEDFRERYNLIDRILGIRNFKIISKSKLDGILWVRGVGLEDAADLFEHMNVYDNRNITDLVQSRAEKTAYENRILAKQNAAKGGPVNDKQTQQSKNATDKYVERKLKKYQDLGDDDSDSDGK